ncbi:MAG: hypothetical protein ACTS8H_02775 [Arsenophonus sp. NC-PE1-MAG3]
MQVYPKLDITCDPLHERIRNTARKLIGTVVELELEAILRQHSERRLY